MKIYLGGKMDGHNEKGNWRLPLVDGMGDYDPDRGMDYGAVQGVEIDGNCGTGEPPEQWPVLSKAILGKHDYVGPYLVRCDHGCYHTGDHATSIDRDADSKEDRDNRRTQIMHLCLRAMVSADVLFFWFDGLDAYGTLAELVFSATVFSALDRAAKESGKREMNKHFFVASPSFDAIDEMWLAFKLVDEVRYICAPTAKNALVTSLSFLDESSSYSPIEKQFIDKWRTVYGNGITPQYNVPGFRYRVDFAFPDDKVAVELDGYEYHNSKEQFTNDRKRQREMESDGWRFIRFSGSEVYNNAEACVRQTYEFWQSLTQVKA